MFPMLGQSSVNIFQSGIELQLMQFFNDKNKMLQCLDNYPVIKELFIHFNTDLCSY